MSVIETDFDDYVYTDEPSIPLDTQEDVNEEEDLISQAIQSDGVEQGEEAQLQSIPTSQGIQLLMEQDALIKRRLAPFDMRRFATYTSLTNEEKERATIRRDSKGRIVDPYHRSLPYLTKYERSGVLSERATLLGHGYDSFLPEVPPEWTLVQIAEEELKQRVIPFILKRRLPNGSIEYWPLQELIDIHY